MKRTSLIITFLALAVLLGAFIGGAFRAQAVEPPAAPLQSGDRWEYLIVSGGSTNLSGSANSKYPRLRKQPDGPFSKENFPLETNLDKLGADGWELVAVMGSPENPVFYLKRPAKSGD